MNREQWLMLLAKRLEPLFKDLTIQPYRITCGWPSRMALGKRMRAIGECHYPKPGADGFHEIFISPLLDNPVRVGGTVVHEVCHVAAGPNTGHGPRFANIAYHVGLVGKPTHTEAGTKLAERISRIAEKIGPYPHKAIEPVLIDKPKPKTLSFTLQCVRCKCKVRITEGWLKEAGLPTCGCGGDMEVK